MALLGVKLDAGGRMSSGNVDAWLFSRMIG
jgi:hypothetical protein